MTNDLVDQKISVNSIQMASDHTGSGISPQSLGDIVRFSEVMSRADIAIPKHLRQNPGACMAVTMQALRWGLDPFSVASKSYSVNGIIAYEAQLIAAVINTRSGIVGRLRYSYEGEGDKLTCTVTGILGGEEYPYTSPPIGQITPKNSPLWKTDPRQQLGYFCARSWGRRHTPEVILGVYDREEAASIQEGPREPPKPAFLEKLAKPQDHVPVTERVDAELDNFGRQDETITEDGEVIDHEPASDPTPPAEDDFPGDRPTPQPLTDEQRETLRRFATRLFVTEKAENLSGQAKGFWKDGAPENGSRMHDLAGRIYKIHEQRIADGDVEGAKAKIDRVLA